MKSASQSAQKWANRAGGASQDYIDGSEATSKDQAAAAIAAKANYVAGLQASFAAGLFEKGLQRSGKSGWLAGVREKGANNYPAGVSAPSAQSKYTTNSGRYDSARNAAANIARGPRGSAQNLNRVTAVVNALRAAKVGK